tara:strand:+ start:121 stop:426 length:306 start_codon:yes stop_codon:yes gene_type:complete
MNNEQLKQAIEQRETEVQGYQTNIDNYTLMIDELSSEWPEDLVKFKGQEIADIVQNITDEDSLIQVADLLFRDKLKITLWTERLEQRKAKLILKILKDQRE